MKGEGPWPRGVERPDSCLLPPLSRASRAGCGTRRKWVDNDSLSQGEPEVRIGGPPLCIRVQSAWLRCLHSKRRSCPSSTKLLGNNVIKMLTSHLLTCRFAFQKPGENAENRAPRRTERRRMHRTRRRVPPTAVRRSGPRPATSGAVHLAYPSCFLPRSPPRPLSARLFYSTVPYLLSSFCIYLHDVCKTARLFFLGSCLFFSGWAPDDISECHTLSPTLLTRRLVLLRDFRSSGSVGSHVYVTAERQYYVSAHHSPWNMISTESILT